MRLIRAIVARSSLPLDPSGRYPTMNNVSTVHYACDVGSTAKGKFGWARVVRNAGKIDARGGTRIDSLLSHVKADLDSGNFALTIGMECPMFLPVPGKSDALGAG